MAKYNVLVEQDEEGWFVAEVAELPGCYTQAKTKKELLDRIKEAIKGYLVVIQESNDDLPKQKFVEMTAVEV
ncbi:MAG TPA: type II toxin-antitoxin system HicB family antitoxin [Candidatus Nanoarchaeia archaeon]|nr:type II toxin-antitoxin system HicB family antitoxin [Candidatus Nanoarchaeia archaeon]